MKNILVIGSATGIGRALTKLLVENGHFVYGTFNKTDPTIQHENIEYNSLDVMSDQFDLSFIPNELHGLVYAPGAINLRPFNRIKPDQFLEDYRLQVLGAIKSIQACFNPLKNAGNASVVLFSTVAVQKGYNFHSLVASSKGAIEGLTRSLAAEFAPTIRVNTVAPSLTNTTLANKLLNSPEKIEASGLRHPLKRVGEPWDIAHAAQFLLSEKSSWITGQILGVDGGVSKISM